MLAKEVTQADDLSREELYACLQLRPTADIDLVERAYWRLAYKHQAEAAAGDLGAKRRLLELNRAMSALGQAQPAQQRRPRLMEEAPPEWNSWEALFDTWWLLVVVAALALGVGLVNHWADVEALSELLGNHTRTLIVAASASLAGLVALPALALLIRAVFSSHVARVRADPYEVLHLHPGADPEIVDIAYQSCLHRYRNARSNGTAVERAIAELGKAYTVLRDPETRASYDRARPPIPDRPESPTRLPIREAPQAPEEMTTQAATVAEAASASKGQPSPSVEGAVRAGAETPAPIVQATTDRKPLALSVARSLGMAAGRVLVLFARLLAFIAISLARLGVRALGGAYRRLRRSETTPAEGSVPRTVESGGKPEDQRANSNGSVRAKGQAPEAEAALDPDRLRTLEKLGKLYGQRQGLPLQNPVPLPQFELPNDPASSPLLARLTVIDDRAESHSFGIEADATITIGSDPTCEIVLSGMDEKIAPQQARIWKREDKFMFHSLSPDLPVAVQGKPFVWVILEDGDLIELGSYRLRFEILDQRATP